MRNRNLIILAAVALAAGAFIFFVERHQPTTDERLERADRIFPELDGEAVVGIEIDTGEGRVLLAKTDDEWRLVEPVDYPADAGVVRTVIESIVNLDAERTLSLDEVESSDYGLDNPVIDVVLENVDGRRFSLAVGDSTPLGSNRAVRRGDGGEILLSSNAFVAGLDKDVDQWRSRDVVEVLEHDLASIDIQTSSDRIRTVRTAGLWQLREPLEDLADREQLQALVSELNALRVSEFLPRETELEGIGLGSPEFVIELVRADGGEPVVLELSAAVESGGVSTMACRRNGIDLFRIPATIGARLAKAPVLWRSAEVWPFTSWDVSTFEITNETGEITLKEVDGVWQFEDGGEADSAETRRRLNALADLSATGHDLLLPPTEVMGSVILVVDRDQDAEGITYTFYVPMDEGGDAAVTVSSRADVMGVDAAVAETIVGDLDRLRPVEEGEPVQE